MTAPLSAFLASVAALAVSASPAMPQTQVSPQLSAPAASQRVAADSIVAVVGTEVITRRELAQRVRNAELQLQQQGTALPARDVLERQVLERAITDRSIVGRFPPAPGARGHGRAAFPP
jgi:peptidyl-prolyl cis-trans isomerase SurA